MRYAWLLLSFLVLLLAEPGLADEPSTISVGRQRILLEDVLPDAPGALADADLGPAPPPGRSIFLSFEDIQLRLRALGIAASQLKLPVHGVRVSSQSKVFTPNELEALVRPSIEAALPPFVSLTSLHVERDSILSPDVRLGQVRLGNIRPRAGRAREVATVELLWGTTVVARLPVSLDLKVEERPETVPVPRGTVLSLVIVKGNVEVTVLAETLGAGRVGESVMLRAHSTKKIVSARLISQVRAEVSL
jgi:Chaperone for flagella basal body P-ring formation